MNLRPGDLKKGDLVITKVFTKEQLDNLRDIGPSYAFEMDRHMGQEFGVLSFNLDYVRLNNGYNYCYDWVLKKEFIKATKKQCIKKLEEQYGTICH